ERARLDRVRRGLDALGDPLPLHQGRRRRRRPACLPRVGASRARRRGAARAGLVGRHAGAAARPLALAVDLRRDRDRHPVSADRGGGAARLVVAGRDHRRRRTAVRRAARAALRRRRTRPRRAARRAAARPRGRRRARRPRRDGLGRGAAGRRRRPAVGLLLRRRPDDPQAPARRPRSACLDGRRARRRRRHLDARGADRAAGGHAVGRGNRVAPRARDLLHRGRVRLLRCTRRRGGTRPRARHHVHRARRRRRARRCDPRRAPGRGRCGGAAADPRRVVAGDGRADAAALATARRHTRTDTLAEARAASSGATVPRTRSDTRPWRSSMRRPAYV
ncbi:MAG: Permease of the drug/metabolite transporter (DMT) superfamily, partial [uncultured Solirubrobacteraceae bacterium]